MTRVTGIGGIFFEARDPAALRTWNRTYEGVDARAWGGVAFLGNAPALRDREPPPGRFPG